MGDTLTGTVSAGSATPWGAILGGAQTLIGLGEKIIGNAKLKKLFKQRKAYETPSEIFDILNSTEFRAQSGFDPETLGFLTNKAERGFATSIGAAERLGADPNILSGLNDEYMQDIMKIGSDNAMLQLQNFDKFLSAKQLVADNKTAEWQSKENLIKDQMQAAGMEGAAGTQDLSSGLNLALSSLTSSQQAKLWQEFLDKQGKT